MRRSTSRLALALAIAFGAGLLAHAAGVPLAWVLGPLTATAALAMAGQPVLAPVMGRRAGQLIVGSTIGLNVTSTVLLALLAWLPAMVITGLFAILLTAAVSLPMARAGAIDVKTAFFAMIPGGLSEMAGIGGSIGAQAEPIALAQALRVALVVLVLPFLVVTFGADGGLALTRPDALLPPLQIVLLLGAGLGGALLLRAIRLNNPWLLGPLLIAAALAASGILAGSMPGPLFYAGQFLLGLAIGARFRREVVARLPRVALASAVCILVMAAVLIAYGALVAAVSGGDLSTLALACAPGGMAEMAVTAQTLHLNVALVTAFHVVRAIMINGFATHYWRLLERGGLGRGARAP